MNLSEDVFGRLSIYRIAFHLSWLSAVGDVWHNVPTCDLVWMSDRAPSARVCSVKVIWPASMKKN